MSAFEASIAPSDSRRALYSLVYVSRAVESFADDRLAALLAQSREANHTREITGILLYRGGRFVQFLEGPEDLVRTMFDRISADPRHTGVRIMVDGHPDARQFAEWTMGYEPSGSLTGPPPDGFRDTFADLDADDADAVLRATRELSLWFRVRADQR